MREREGGREFRSFSFKLADIITLLFSQLYSPLLNSFNITVRVDLVTLNVEFCCGYAGVTMGIKWLASAGLI